MDVAGARQEYGMGSRVVPCVGRIGQGIYSNGVWLWSEVANRTPHARNDRTVFKLIEADASATSARSRGNDIQDRKRHGKMERSAGVGNGTSRASEGRMSFCPL